MRYTSDSEPGIRRRRAGRGFAYRGPAGEPVDTETRAWIGGLAIPPAWTDVWISSVRDGHLLATGRDARGRKQYRYHPDFRRRQDRRKYDRLASFGSALPGLRRTVARDLARPGLPRERVVAAVVALLDETSIRVGNDDYARMNGSFGLTTLRSRHARVTGDAIRFTFRGKSGRSHRVGLRDRRLAAVVRRCQELPGQRLFRYEVEPGRWEAITSEDVNDYLRAAMGDDVSAKDFRTWNGTLAAVLALGEAPADVRSDRRTALRLAVAEVADQLGNTPSIARQAYIHPAVGRAFERGAIPAGPFSARSAWRRPGELELLRLLRT